MKLKPGYKQTEAGVIPDDWGVKPLSGSIAIIHGYGFQSQYFKTLGQYRLTTPGHFHESGGFREVGEKQKYYDGPLPDGYLLSAGDLIVAMTEQADGLLGSAALIPLHGNFLHNQRLGKVKALSSDVSIGYLYRVFNSKAYRSKVRETAAGTKVKHTSPSKLLEIAVALPPTKAEQEVIAYALSDADALIESLEQLIAKKRHLKQGAMQELLRPKGGWVTRKLEEIAKILSGGTPSTMQANFWQGDILWCTPTDVTALHGYKYLTETSRTITPQGLMCSSAEMIPADSIVMTSRATIGACAINKVPVSTNQGFKNFVPFENVDVEFLYYLLLMKKHEFINLCGGSTFLEIGKTQLAVFELQVPSTKTEQTAIAAILSDMDAEIIALESKLAKVRQLKQGMMQNLLTGKIRLI